jgi:ubiquinone/menaquinone biosynthesis C-methylase UbiE
MAKNIEFFNDKLAKLYDEATLKGKWLAPIEANKLLLQFGLIKKNLTVLDIGAGTGQTIQPFVNENCEIYAVDISAEMLKIVKKKYPEVKIFEYDITKGLSGLKFKNNFFNVIIAVGVLEFVENIKKIVKEANQLLKNNGYFIFTYEMFLPQHKLQKSKVQYNADGYIDNPSNIAKFKLYRRDKKEINTIFHNTGFQAIRHFKIKAYLKGPKKIPVYYGIVLAGKNKK